MPSTTRCHGLCVCPNANMSPAFSPTLAAILRQKSSGRSSVKQTVLSVGVPCTSTRRGPAEWPPSGRRSSEKGSPARKRFVVADTARRVNSAETMTGLPAIAISVTSACERQAPTRTRRPRSSARANASCAPPGRVGPSSSERSSSSRLASDPVRAAVGCDSPLSIRRKDLSGTQDIRNISLSSCRSTDRGGARTFYGFGLPKARTAFPTYSDAGAANRSPPGTVKGP
jgi:hypothetical protein